MEYLQDIITGNLRLFKMTHYGEKVTKNKIDKFCRSMGWQLESKYDLGPDVVNIRKQFEEKLRLLIKEYNNGII